MATNFYPVTKISVLGPLSISDKRSADMPLDIRGRIETLTDITTIPFAWEGMLVYVRDTKEYYKVTSLSNRTVSGVTIPYYPATWEKFGSGGSTPSPTPSDIDAGDVTYRSSGTFGINTVGKELQSLANDILSLAEDIHNLSGDIGTLSNLNTENKQDLVAAINEVLASTGSTIAVVNNLLSNSTTDALSAYQGKVLKGLIDGKVAGIKVQGETSILPMDINGIVTIPAGGGGGTGTITGATVGGSQVPEAGGILQFQAYPTVPITGIKDANGNTLAPVDGIVTLPQAAAAPTADTMQYSDSINYSTGSIGKAVKDSKIAANISYDDSITQFSTLENPVHDVQTAINVLATAIASGQCIFSVTVKDYNAAPLADKELTVSYSLNGTTTPLSNIVTDSSGNCTFVIPYGATYSIIYPNVTDRLKPNTSTGIATNAHMLIQIAYELQADNEELFIGVQLRNASMSQYNVEGKKVYIYYKESGNWHVTPDITITLAADGTIATGGVEYKNVVTPSDTCIIPRDTNYKVSLQEWNPELPVDEQDFIKSEDTAFTATEFTRQYIGYYYYKKAGIFLAIEDYEGSIDLNTWTEYRCKDVDTTNWIATIHDDSDNKDYKIKYDSTYGLMRLDISDLSGTWEQWYSIANLSRVLGVGVRTSNLIDAAIGNVDYSTHGFETSCFLIPYNVNKPTSAMQNNNNAWTGLSRGISGKYTTDEMLASSDPFSDMAILINSITKKIGSYTQNAFIGSNEQLSSIRANRDAIVTLLKCVNNSELYSTGNLILTSCTETGTGTNNFFIRVAISGTVPSTPLSKNNDTHKTIPLFAI